MIFSGAWADGVSSHLFTYKGNIKVSPLTQDQTLEQALDHAITVGAEDVIGKKTMKQKWLTFLPYTSVFY